MKFATLVQFTAALPRLSILPVSEVQGNNIWHFGGTADEAAASISFSHIAQFILVI